MTSDLTLHIISMHTDPFAQPGNGSAGGMNVYIVRSLAAMMALDNSLRVEVFTLEHGAASPLPSALEPYAERIVSHRIICPGFEQASRDEQPAFTIEFARRCLQAAQWRPDIIHAHYWLSALAALEMSSHYAADSHDVPVFFTPHTTAATKDARRGEHEQAEPAYRYEAEEKILRLVALSIVNTPLEASDISRYYGASEESLVVIAPGVDTSIFRPDPSITREHAGSVTSASLYFAGRAAPLKGAHLLVEALAYLPTDISVDLHLISDINSEYMRSLMLRAAELGCGQRVHLHPSAPPRELAAYFQRADIVACPSSSETFGLVALESQACGAAVLASDADGLRYAVENGYSGMLVAERTASAWAAAIESLVRDPKLRAVLGAQAAERARGFSWEATASSLVEAYRAAAAEAESER